MIAYNKGVGASYKRDSGRAEEFVSGAGHSLGMIPSVLRVLLRRFDFGESMPRSNYGERQRQNYLSLEDGRAWTSQP